ncbi:HAD family hydrolase [Streptomyces sp. NPDC079020]|uniref:HAD family hydrolase n=1 Tax=Streptomyces sp. NPDC079020 TaxID=3365722 RepID=UPI0037D15F24
MPRARRGVGEAELVRLVAAAEADSEHPLAQAIVSGARARCVQPPAATGFDSVTGKGVRATADGHTILVGTTRLLHDNGVDTSPLDAVAANFAAEGKTPVLAAVDGYPAGVLAVADTVKDDSAQAIAALRRLDTESSPPSASHRRPCATPSRTCSSPSSAAPSASLSLPAPSTPCGAYASARSSPQPPWPCPSCPSSPTPPACAAGTPRHCPKRAPRRTRPKSRPPPTPPRERTARTEVRRPSTPCAAWKSTPRPHPNAETAPQAHRTSAPPCCATAYDAAPDRYTPSISRRHP